LKTIQSPHNESNVGDKAMHVSTSPHSQTFPWGT